MIDRSFANTANNIMPRRLYGRRQSRRLSSRKNHLLNTYLNNILLTEEDIKCGSRLRSALMAMDIPIADLRLEIGFGGGEHLVTRAEQNAKAGFIGCEIFNNGFATTVDYVSNKNINNIALIKGDARYVIELLPANILSTIYILYPDPWPKRRHFKRRFICAHTLELMARVLKPGGMVYFASDIENYSAWTLNAFHNCDRFSWINNNPGEWLTPFTNWPGTRYERKAIRSGRIPVYLSFTKIK